MLKQIVRAVLSLSFSLAAVSSFAAEEIRLVDLRSSACPPVSGCYASTYFKGVVEVKNLAYGKQVTMVYKNNDGSWSSTNGQYLAPSTSGKELWTVSLPAPVSAVAFKYVVNGQTYWDNNGGKNYAINVYGTDALLGYPAISGAFGQYEENISMRGRYIRGNILVKNLSGTKTIKAVYTDNNWATSKTSYLSYASTAASGVEFWNFTLPIADTAKLENVKIAFQYTWPSGNVWDNNYGKNYRIVSGQISR